SLSECCSVLLLLSQRSGLLLGLFALCALNCKLCFSLFTVSFILQSTALRFCCFLGFALCLFRCLTRNAFFSLLLLAFRCLLAKAGKLCLVILKFFANCKSRLKA